MKRFWKRILGERGLSLLELTVVMAVIAVLAALTAVAVTGTTSSAKATAKANDEGEVTKAAQNFAGTQPKSFQPVTTSGTGLETIQAVFTVDEASPIGADLDGDGALTSTAVEVYEINFSADDGSGKLFVPGYLPKTPKHADAKIAAKDASGLPVEIGVWVIVKSSLEAKIAVADTSY